MKVRTYLGPLLATIAIILALVVVAFSWLPRRAKIVRHDIADAAARLAETATVNKLIKESGLDRELGSLGPYTAFYPTDDAFKKLAEGVLDRLRRPHNRELLRALLFHHVVQGKYSLDDIAGMDRLTTLGGQELGVGLGARGVEIENARIIRADIECTNGMVHVVDSVIQVGLGKGQKAGVN